MSRAADWVSLQKQDARLIAEIVARMDLRQRELDSYGTDKQAWVESGLVGENAEQTYAEMSAVTYDTVNSLKDILYTQGHFGNLAKLF